MIDVNESKLMSFLKESPAVVPVSPQSPAIITNPVMEIKNKVDSGEQVISSIVRILDSLNSLANSPIVKTIFTPDKKESRMKNVENSPNMDVKPMPQNNIVTTIKEEPKKEEPKKEEPKKEEMMSIDKAMLIYNFTEEFLKQLVNDDKDKRIEDIYNELIENKEPFIMGLNVRFNQK